MAGVNDKQLSRRGPWPKGVANVPAETELPVNQDGAIIALAVAAGGAVYAKRAEDRGEEFAAKVYTHAHCGFAAWNFLVLLAFL